MKEYISSNLIVVAGNNDNAKFQSSIVAVPITTTPITTTPVIHTELVPKEDVKRGIDDVEYWQDADSTSKVNLVPNNYTSINNKDDVKNNNVV